MYVVINSFETKTSDAKKESRVFQETFSYTFIPNTWKEVTSSTTEEYCGKQKQDYIDEIRSYFSLTIFCRFLHTLNAHQGTVDVNALFTSF